MKKARDSRFELIRIISILLIIFYHITLYSGIKFNTDPLSPNLIINIMFGIWGKVGVILFVIISSWFLLDKDKNDSQKIIKMCFKIWLTSILLLFVFYIFKLVPIDFKTISKEVLTPFYYNGYKGNYYFITVYIVFYLLTPYMNILIKNLNDKQLRKILLIMLVSVSLYNFVYENIGSHLYEFVFIYFATAYLKRNKNNHLKQKSKLLFVVSYLTIVISIISLKYIADNYNCKYLYDIISRFYSRDYFLLHLLSFSLFYMILSLKPFVSKTLNTLSKHTLGVYIISDNLLLRQNGNSFLFKTLFKSYSYINSWYYALYLLVEITLIFVVCTIIDILIDRIVSLIRIVNTRK